MHAEIFSNRFETGILMAGSYPPILDTLERGSPVRLVPVGGGCIADARLAYFADDTSVFVKTARSVQGMFEAEALGLRELDSAGVIRVPRVLAVGEGALVLERIQAAPKKSGFFESFGRAFAKLHQHRGAVHGFSSDNFIGSTDQINTPLEAPGWPEFFLQRRLRYQVQLTVSNGFGDELESLLDRAEDNIADLLGESVEAPSLLHGDLWSGNFMVDEQGGACLIDPAVYYGHREADLAMTRLFGGFPPDFYHAYEELTPLAPGHRQRLPIYQLYHLLNHLNLFGTAYFAQCRQILQGLAA
jgi:protein-ribulosamine 3-kinase